VTLLGRLVHDERTNAGLAWLLLGVTGVVAVREVLGGTVLWGLFGLCLVLVVAAPALVTRDRLVIVPWPLPALAAAAGISRAYGIFPEVAGYLAIVALALVVTVELDVFTSVDLSRRFVVAFAVLSTLAIQALWTVVQFYSDRWLGSDLLHSQAELQWDIVAVTVVAAAVGTAFVWYFERFSSTGTEETLTPEEETT
jgi:hypothetical protein